MTYKEKYLERLNEYDLGKISDEEWYEFCALIFEYILEDNPNILDNLKGEWQNEKFLC